MATQPSKYSQYGKVSNATMNYDQVKRDATGAVVSTKYDAYAKISDKPQANYHILPSAQKLYESAFGGAAAPSAAPLPAGGAASSAAAASSSASSPSLSLPPLGGPPPVPGRPPLGAPPPATLGGAPAPPTGEADKAKKKLCQRCEVAKATAKVTIEDLPVKLCDPCANAVQSNPAAAREALNRARGGGAAGGSSAPPGPCELCRKFPQHVRTMQTDGSAITVCAQCMSFQPFFKQLTTYAVSCVANKNLPEAQTSFEELLMLSPEHPSTLYNCACVEALLQQPDRSLRLLERALKAGYTNYKTIKNDSDLKAVRKLAEFKPLLEKYTSKKGLFKKSSARDVDAAPPSPSPPGGPVRTPSSGSLLTNSGGAPPPNSNPDYVSSALLQGNYNAVNAVTYSQLHPDAVTGGGPPGLGAAPAPPGLGAPPAVPSKGGPPPGAPARTPSLTNATAATAAAAAAKPVEYKSLSDVKKIAPVVYDAKLGDQAGKTEEKAPVTYESSMEAMKRGAPAPVVYDAKLDADGISAEDLAALDEMAAGLGSDDEDDDPPRAPDDADEPVAASPPVAAAAPTPAAPAAGAAPVIAKPRGALPIPTRGAPPSVPARGATPPVTIAKPRGPLPTPAARGASPQPGIAKPRGPLPTPVRAGAPAPAGGLAMPALPAAAIAGGIVLEPLSDEESD